ncbi:phage virion morphogenesis protein [Rhodoplanes sp. TEM]|uniref:Phage virion morphogenesis protein n=1 Tax=Rhodoplanes tepidamans TaxID=200616 RepID=A0ABT5JEC8_RHOTP|nr:MULTISPECIES: phage virion morphogenesis protein [Rhodoplanes]MDC7787976.1 phage virion morphogenesis protein [Rhodoplanes tepidamans]MDC7984816.1 phage virion morphogenesis protein [Rhodoplanes sp. TEM]MDQ0358405.1 phage virion morphogenesis protein [Rhodoplanes tepidamans]
MAGATLETTIDDAVVLKAFAALQRLMTDTTPVLRAIGTGLVENTHTRFEEARDPQGNAWAALNPDYAPLKRGPGTLRESAMRGGLMGSITFRAARDSVEVGTNKIYAAVHQFGATIEPVKASHLVFRLASGLQFRDSVTIPARPFLGISKADEETIADTIADAIDRRTPRA